MREDGWLRVMAPAARLLLQGGREAREAAGAIWGVPFSEERCRAQRADGRATLWLGPDEHLMWQAARERAVPLAELERSLAPFPHSLVDVSHRQIAIEISHPDAAIVLAGACPLDLAESAFPVDMCTRTVLGKAEIVLWRTAHALFHVEVWRSFAAYVEELLREIAHD